MHHLAYCCLQACKDMARFLFDLLDLLVICITFCLLVFPASSDDSVRSIRVQYNGRNRPACLGGNGTSCQSLDYVFRNLQHVQAQAIIVSIASPQVITVKSAQTSDSTNTLTLLGDNKDSSTGGNRVTVNFNSINFNFSGVDLTFQGLEIVDSKSLIFNGNVMIDDCSITRVDCLAIVPATITAHIQLTFNNSLVRDSKFSANGFLYYVPSGGNYPYFTVLMYLYNTNFTKNDGKVLTLVSKSAVSYYSEVRVENCIFFANTDPDFNFTILTGLSYGLNFNIINTVIRDNADFSLIISMTGGGSVSGVTFNMIGLSITNNTNTAIVTGDGVLNGKTQLKDSSLLDNDGLVLDMNSFMGKYGCTLGVSNVTFKDNKNWTVHVNPQSVTSISNCFFEP